MLFIKKFFLLLFTKWLFLLFINGFSIINNQLLKQNGNVKRAVFEVNVIMHIVTVDNSLESLKSRHASRGDSFLRQEVEKIEKKVENKRNGKRSSAFCVKGCIPCKSHVTATCKMSCNCLAYGTKGQPYHPESFARSSRVTCWCIIPFSFIF